MSDPAFVEQTLKKGAVAAQEQADQAVNPEVQKADAQLEKAKRRERLLLLFPAGALGLTIALIVITRRRKNGDFVIVACKSLPCP
mgnify:CR=1 FL=1